MAKRSKAIQEVVDRVNETLSLDHLWVENNEGEIAYLASSELEVRNFKHGMCSFLETLLHSSNCYRGYRYINDINDRWARKYY